MIGFRRTTRVAAAAVLLAGVSQASAQVRPIYDQGVGELAGLLQRLQTTASILHTGAHPDDEDSALVAYHARHDHARTAYLSLTRGAGGQNIIGPEQSDLLGIIRTEELLQARRLDGAGQYFTRAIDFGFSKHRREAAALWDEDRVLADMVMTIRSFRPDIVVSRWSGTPADGHGHHQFAGYLTPLAVEAAGDPARFPWQVADGLEPWRVSRLYVVERGTPAPPGAALVYVDTGIRDAIAGRSYFQIGMQGRSQQKTQQMGSLEYGGSQVSALRLVSGEPPPGRGPGGVLEGLNTSIVAIGRFEPRPSARFARLLRRIKRSAGRALDRYDPFAPAGILPELVDGLRAARTARGLAQAFDSRRLLDEKIAEFERAVLAAAGVGLDALADVETALPGGEVAVALRLYRPAGSDARILDAGLAVPNGWHWSVDEGGHSAGDADPRRRDMPAEERRFSVSVPRNEFPSEPYWLRHAANGFMYDWSDAGRAATLPFARPLVEAVARVEVAGEPVEILREAEFRTVDPVRGELRRRIDVVPRLVLRAADRLTVLPVSGGTREVQVRFALSNNAAVPARADVSLRIPDGWLGTPATTAIDLAPAPAGAVAEFTVAVPADAGPGAYDILAEATVDGTRHDLTQETVAYPHIRTHRRYVPAVSRLRIVDVEIADVRIGYVMGSGDLVPDALRQVGADVTLLDDAELATGDLDRFDTIVVGIRASQTRSGFVGNNSRLLEFARRGGALIVQYQQQDYTELGLTPFPADMGTSVVRVVDENAPVRILAPEHPVFTYPNRISDTDFEGWVQERNNYNFVDFDAERYLPLTESHDPGEPDSRGGMVYARIGEGHYVYTGFSWFRQLPAGVPGAYRLFANLLSLPESRP